MQDYEVTETLEDAFFANGIQPDLVVDMGLLVDGIEDVEININEPERIAGTCSIAGKEPKDGDDCTIHGTFEMKLVDNTVNAVTFGKFEIK